MLQVHSYAREHQPRHFQVAGAPTLATSQAPGSASTESTPESRISPGNVELMQTEHSVEEDHPAGVLDVQDAALEANAEPTCVTQPPQVDKMEMLKNQNKRKVCIHVSFRPQRQQQLNWLLALSTIFFLWTCMQNENSSKLHYFFFLKMNMEFYGLMLVFD